MLAVTIRRMLDLTEQAANYVKLWASSDNFISIGIKEALLD